MPPRKSPYLKLELQIAADDRGGIDHRWQYGRQLLAARAGRRRLPKGMLADLVADAKKAGLNLSEQELQRRMKLAETYPTEAHKRQALMLMGSWSAIVNAGFPPVEVTEPEDLEAAGISTAAPDEFEQLSLIPGLSPVLSVAGRRVPLAEATVADVKAYRDMYAQIHENYGKRLALIETALAAMLAGGADDDANAVQAWRAGLGDDDGEPPDTT